MEAGALFQAVALAANNAAKLCEGEDTQTKVEGELAAIEAELLEVGNQREELKAQIKQLEDSKSSLESKQGVLVQKLKKRKAAEMLAEAFVTPAKGSVAV